MDAVKERVMEARRLAKKQRKTDRRERRKAATALVAELPTEIERLEQIATKDAEQVVAAEEADREALKSIAADSAAALARARTALAEAERTLRELAPKLAA